MIKDFLQKDKSKLQKIIPCGGGQYERIRE